MYSDDKELKLYKGSNHAKNKHVRQCAFCKRSLTRSRNDKLKAYEKIASRRILNHE
jgi:hypothetical protein